MSNGEFYRIDKLLPYHIKPKDRMDLETMQFQPEETTQLNPSQDFPQIYSKYLNDAGRVEHNAVVGEVTENDQVRLAMHDLEKTYGEVMEIGRQIEKAFQELLQMQ